MAILGYKQDQESGVWNSCDWLIDQSIGSAIHLLYPQEYGTLLSRWKEGKGILWLWHIHLPVSLYQNHITLYGQSNTGNINRDIVRKFLSFSRCCDLVLQRASVIKTLNIFHDWILSLYLSVLHSCFLRQKGLHLL